MRQCFNITHTVYMRTLWANVYVVCVYRTHDKILRLCGGLTVCISENRKATDELFRQYKNSENGFASVEFLETRQERIGMSGPEPTLPRPLTVARTELGRATCLECSTSLGGLKNTERLLFSIIDNFWSRNSTQSRNIIYISKDF